MSNPFSTDIDREQTERIDPEHTRHLILMAVTSLLVGSLCALGLILGILHADYFDSIDVRTQLLIVMVVFSIGGISWFIWRITKLF